MTLQHIAARIRRLEAPAWPFSAPRRMGEVRRSTVGTLCDSAAAANQLPSHLV
jgi:hypothetical protein